MNYTDEKEAISILEMFYHAKDYKALKEVTGNKDINNEVRGYASGLLMRPLLPWGAMRKIVFFILIILSIILPLLFCNILFLAILILPLVMSPRIIGETLHFIGSNK